MIIDRTAVLAAALAAALTGCAATQPTGTQPTTTQPVSATAPAAGAASAPRAATNRDSAAVSAPSAAASTPGAAAGRPPAECLQVLDRLSQGIPRDETGPVLRSKGLRIASPIQVPDGVVSDTSIVSGARVRMMIDAQGRVVPGTVTVQQAVGDAKLPLALTEAVPATLRFDVSAAFSLPPQFAFTTVYVVCARS